MRQLLPIWSFRSPISSLWSRSPCPLPIITANNSLVANRTRQTIIRTLAAPYSNGSGSGSNSSNNNSLRSITKRANSRATASFYSNDNTKSSTNNHNIQSLPTQVSFEDFLQADTNRDGRVTAAEWDNYIRSKQTIEEDPLFRGVTIHIPVSPAVLREIIESDGFGISMNGLHYSLHVKPEGKTIDLIKRAQTELERLTADIEVLEAKKAPLDAAAARHTRRVMSGILAYLLIQAGVVAKLTFFSRFGWDIMEPITYFITFGISLVGLSFFTWNRLEFSYPALAALVARRKAVRLYRKFKFDEDALLALRRDRDRVKRQLDAMVPAHRIFDLENKSK